MKKHGFIHPDLFFEYQVVTRVEDILPELEAAARSRSEMAIEGAAKVIEKL